MSNRNWFLVALMVGLSVVAMPEVAVAKDTKQLATAANPLDLNTATVEELQALPGIGAVKAKAIVEGRPYTSLKDFESRNIVPPATVEKFKSQVTVSRTKTKPATTDTAATQSAEQPAGKVDLNTATVEQLQALPGIGPAKAKAIVESRPYTSLKDFESRNILAASALEKVKGQIAVSRTAAKPVTTQIVDEQNPPEPVGKIDLNSATAEELEMLPGVGPARAKAIVDGRPYTSLAQFESKGLLPPAAFGKLKSAVEVVPVAGKAASTQGSTAKEAAQKRIRMCGSMWRAAKAENTLPSGATWPQYWSQCNAALKNQGY